MMRLMRNWFQRHFSDPQVVGLVILLIIGFATIVFMGNMLTPVFAGVVIAYLLEGSVKHMERFRIPRWIAVSLVFSVFLAVLFSVIFGLLPLLSQQLTQLVKQLPSMIIRGQNQLLGLSDSYPYLFSEEQVKDLIRVIRSEMAQLGQKMLSFSLASVASLAAVALYLIIVPILVFFFLKDKNLIIHWFTKFLPLKRQLATQVWQDVDIQISNYIRGKFLEFLIVWVVVFITFYLMELQFSVLLSFLVGISVIIPYVGALIVTFPVAFVAYAQWGFGSEFTYLFTIYALIHALDGNVLVPLLFSEVVNLHPVAIIIAILVFGSFWGFWGVFFAIPLATLVQTLLKLWPAAR
ncbi:putative permease [Candidatus Nitrosacidococcus tergens]|uniref:Putative permease n=2 Tax=Candidatus Nitrosacidococcus tergens TaxID=553981 RepID=A0A7G1Q9J3_9GAMM|nr:putative permease [Candidatus Nitrosacidococcus tergens]